MRGATPTGWTWPCDAHALSVIQQVLGHDDPRTTSIYTAAHTEDLSAASADAGAL